MKTDLTKHEINSDQNDNISAWDNSKTRKGFMTNKKLFLQICNFSECVCVCVKVTKPLKTSGH